MALLERLFHGKPKQEILYPGDERLDVVGEWYHQDALWRIVGGHRHKEVQHETQAVLMPDSADSEYPEAIRVVVDGKVVGSLSREHAPVYRPGLLRLMVSSGRSVALKGTIVGRPDRPRGLGVTVIADADLSGPPQVLEMFLHHDPLDFGVTPQERHRADLQKGGFRTGWSEAVNTDRADDRYDLSWFNELLQDESKAIERLRVMLESEQDPVDRHYMMCELESRLYRKRDESASALDEYDAVCRQHDSEMDTIRPALLDKFGVVPVIDMYRQEAIRWMKAHDWERSRTWAERGISIYGDDAGRPDAVDDLRKRVAHALAKADDANHEAEAEGQARTLNSDAAASSVGDACLRLIRGQLPTSAHQRTEAAQLSNLSRNRGSRESEARG